MKGVVVLALALAGCLSGCGDPPQCKPGPPPVYVNVTGARPGDRLTVCTPRLGCVSLTATGRTQSVALPTASGSAALDGEVVTARSNDRRDSAVLRYHDGGDGICSYSWSTAVLRLH